MNKVVVEHEYIAKEPDELTIKKGDIITDVVKKQGGWWEGVLRDKKGMFPDNFVRPLDKDSSVVLRSQKDVTRIRQCRVIFSYNQDHVDELSLRVGDVIDIVGEEEEGWWRGNLNGKEGVFPSNFVKELTWQPSPSTRVISNNLENENDNKPPKLPAKPSRQLCEATYPYKAQNEDELSFQEGDIITILNKDSQDPGWWHGELNGKSGVFPDNFVVLISDNKINNKENRKSVSDKGAIKSVSVASQRKSLEPKKEISENIVSELNKPAPITNKPSISVKKSPSNSGLGIFSGLKKKIEDAVDGSIGSKHVTVSDEIPKNNDNVFDNVERRPLLTDVRATRVKAPGRRLPTTAHKDDPPAFVNDSENLPLQIKEEQPADSSVKPRLREWEKHKAPWLEEMKKNQVRRTMISTFEETSSETEVSLKVDITKSVHEANISNELEKIDKLNSDVVKNSIAHNIKDIPENATGILFTETISKSPAESQRQYYTDSSADTSLVFKTKRINFTDTSDTSDTSPAAEPKHQSYAHLLRRLERLEDIVQNQNHSIEELQTKLQIEMDLRILLQEKLQKLHS